MFAIALLPVLLTGCRTSEADLDLPGITVGLDPAPGALFLRTLTVTSGSGPDLLLDGSTGTTWKPPGEAADEAVDLVFDTPVAADAITLEACERTDVRVFLNGTGGPRVRLQAGKPQAVDLTDPQARELRWLRIGVESGSACLAEVSISEGGERLPLRPPRTVAGHVRATSTRVPASVYSARWLVDGNADRGWATDEPARLLITLDEPVDLTKLEVVPLGDSPVPDVTIEPALPAGPRDTFTISLAGPGAIGELRGYDSHGPIALAIADDPEQSALPEIVGRGWQSVCGETKRRIKLRPDGSFVVRRTTPGEGAADVFVEGSWGIEPIATRSMGPVTPWSTLVVRGRRWSTAGRWDAADGTQAIDSTFSFAPVAQLGKAGLAAELKQWAEASSDRSECLAFELGAWDDAYAALETDGALVVRGPDFEDLVWHP